MEINGIQIFDIKAFLENYWPDQSKWPTDAVRCPRCLGSGRYSFNPRDMDRCFWCSIDGTYRGYILPGHKHYDWVKESKRYQVRGVRCNFTTDDENQIVPFLKKAAQIANQHWDDRFDMSIKAIDWQTDHHVFYERVDGKWTKCFDSIGPRPEPTPEEEYEASHQGEPEPAVEPVPELTPVSTGYTCKCGKEVFRPIEGELICQDCWDLSQMSDEDIEHAKQVERMLTHCNSDDCDAPLITVIEKREKFCQSCLDEMKKENAMQNKMYFTGVVDSEEMMRGDLDEEKHVYVAQYKYENAPEHLRDNPEYWAERVRSGEFYDGENYPIAWIEPEEYTKEVDGDVQYAMTHCNHETCIAFLNSDIEKKELLCHKHLAEMANKAPYDLCPDCGQPIDDRDSKQCNNCIMKSSEHKMKARLEEVKRQIKALDAQEQRIIAARPNHPERWCKHGTCQSCEELLQVDYTRHKLYKEMDRLEHKLEMFG